MMNAFIKPHNVLYIFLLFPPVSSAAETKEESLQLDPVQVSDVAESVPTANQLQPETSQSSSDAGEALRSINGVSATRMGGLGLDLSVRGQSQNRLNIVLDGAYIHGGCPNRMDPATSYSPIESYDEITVIKGSQTVLYGSGGSGGTVLLERSAPTFSDGKPWKLQSHSAYSSHNNSWKNGLDLAMGDDKLALRAIYEQSDAENYKDGEGHTVRSAFSSESKNIITYFKPTKNQQIKLDYEQTNHSDVLYAGAGMDSPESDNKTIRASYLINLENSWLSSIEASSYQSLVNHVMDNFSLRDNNRKWQSVSSDSDTTGGKLIAHVDQEDHDYSFGIDFQKNIRNAIRSGGMPGMPPSRTNSIFWPGAYILQKGLFAEFHQPTSKGDLSSGIRLDHTLSEIQRGDESVNQAMAGISTPNQLYARYYQATSDHMTENNLNGFLRFSFLPHKKYGQWSVSLSRNVRNADATERYIANNMNMSMNGGMDMSWIGNNNLKSEKHLQTELGWSVQKGAIKHSLNLYYDHIADYILRDRARGQQGILVNSPSVTIFRNVSAKIFGFEYNQDWSISPHWDILINANLTHAQNTTDDRPIAQISPLELNTTLNYSGKQWQIGLEFITQARQNRADIIAGSGLDQQKTPGWSILNLKSFYQFEKHWKLGAGITNIFNRSYAYHVNRANQDPFNPELVLVNEPGRSLWIKLNSNW